MSRVLITLVLMGIVAGSASAQTRPTVTTTSPANNGTVDVNHPIYLWYTADVTAKTGAIHINRVTDNALIEVVDPATLVYSGNRLTIYPTRLEPNTDYRITAFVNSSEDASGTGVAGLGFFFSTNGTVSEQEQQPSAAAPDEESAGDWHTLTLPDSTTVRYQVERKITVSDFVIIPVLMLILGWLVFATFVSSINIQKEK